MHRPPSSEVRLAYSGTERVESGRSTGSDTWVGEKYRVGHMSREYGGWDTDWSRVKVWPWCVVWWGTKLN